MEKMRIQAEKEKDGEIVIRLDYDSATSRVTRVMISRDLVRELVKEFRELTGSKSWWQRFKELLR